MHGLHMPRDQDQHKPRRSLAEGDVGKGGMFGCWETSLHYLAWEFLISGFGLGIFGFGFWVGVWCLVFGFTSRKYPKPPIFYGIFAWKNGCCFFSRWLSLKGWFSKHDCGRKGIRTQLSHIILPNTEGKKKLTPLEQTTTPKTTRKMADPNNNKKKGWKWWKNWICNFLLAKNLILRRFFLVNQKQFCKECIHLTGVKLRFETWNDQVSFESTFFSSFPWEEPAGNTTDIYIYRDLEDITIRNITRHHDLHNRPCLTTACVVRFEDLRMKNEHPLLNSNPPKSSRMHPTLFPASLNKNPTLPFRVFDHLDFKGKYPPHERCVCVF